MMSQMNGAEIQWDDVTLSDILGDLDDVAEVDEDPAGATIIGWTTQNRQKKRSFQPWCP